MANTYTLISSNVLSSSAASVTFSSIPATYTDLVLRISTRITRADYEGRILMSYNSSSTSDYSETWVREQASVADSGRYTSQTGHLQIWSSASTATASTFGSGEIYIPNYAGATNKPMSAFTVSENNSTNSTIAADAGLRSNTAAITSITMAPSDASNFVSGSSFYLYGIKNS
jgi:hypothetical protein